MILGTVLGLAGASVVWSEKAPAAGEPGENHNAWQEGDEGGGNWTRQLNLTDDQVKKMRDERTQQQKDMVKLRADMETAHIDLWNEVNADSPDTSKIEKLTKQIGEDQGKILGDRINTLVYMRSILTPEQKKKMNEMQTQFECGPGKETRGPHHMMGGAKEGGK
jgi:Spy/CpxP family protein refolding chaperone